MKIAVVAGLFAERDVEVDHFLVCECGNPDVTPTLRSGQVGQDGSPLRSNHVLIGLVCEDRTCGGGFYDYEDSWFVGPKCCSIVVDISYESALHPTSDHSSC